MPVGEQPVDRGLGAATVVQQHRVRLQRPRRPVEEHHGHAHLDLAAQVRVVLPGGYHEQAVDPALAQLHQQRPFPLHVLLGRRGHQQRLVVGRDLGGNRGDGGVERVRDLLDEQPDGRVEPPGTQVAGDVIAPEAQLGDGGQHPVEKLR